MGLERISRVRAELGLVPSFPIITVGGTNGKGSSCAMMEAILSNAGYRVGCYTSPHLLRYNERVRIGRQEASDEALCNAFQTVESARIRSDVTLTYFEFGTLAAMQLFSQAEVEIAILEVGLAGGWMRLIFLTPIARCSPVWTSIIWIIWATPARKSGSRRRVFSEAEKPRSAQNRISLKVCIVMRMRAVQI